MKARTKARRRFRRVGRPRTEDAAREPNGRISRSGIDHGPADIVALVARARHTGLPVDKVRDQKAGTFIGYLNILGRVDGISDEQYDAAVSFLDLRHAYLRAIKAPQGEMDKGAPGNGGDVISEEYERWCAKTIARYMECRRAIQEAQNVNRTENLWAALDHCIIRGDRQSHMIGPVRVLCNALVRFFRG